MKSEFVRVKDGYLDPVVCESKTCRCGATLPVLKVKKDTPNKGRPFVWCKTCDFFEWQDMPKCKCGATLYEATVKKQNKNFGRKFRNCPNRCEGSFQWIP